MTRLFAVAGLVLVAGCKADREAAWALDPIYVEPAEDGITGFQTWEIFTARWSKKHRGKHYLCAIVVGFSGTPSSCPECAFAWDITPTLLETDCPDDVADAPLALSLQGIGISAFASDSPHEDQSSEGWADYGYGWEVHGWAYPAALDNGHPSDATGWDGTEPYTLWPTAAWPL